MAAQRIPLVQKRNIEGDVLQDGTYLSPCDLEFIHRNSSRHELSNHLRQEMQDFFRVDLSRVRLYQFPAGLRGVRESSAFSVREDVFFSKESFAPETLPGRMLLAHELAHVVQNRVGSTLQDAALKSLDDLELEASSAAIAYMTGSALPRLTPNRCHDVLYWGRVGHYYTVFVIALFAGIDRATAARLAFFAQMPDQVIELDAIVAGEDILCPPHPVVMAVKAGGQYIRGEVSGNRGGATPIEIQRGLHCLTGGDAEAETSTRARILRDDNLRMLWKTGLALHAYGDSFAHRVIGDPKILYSTGPGHFFDSEQGNDPDNVSNPKRKDLYIRYCRSMHSILSSAFNSQPTRNSEQVEDLASKVAAKLDEDSQAKEITMQAGLGNVGFPFMPTSYHPDGLERWTNFQKLYRRLVPQADVINDIGKTAKVWATMSRKRDLGDFHAQSTHAATMTA